ncbi:IS21 family transposase, partial [candidate division KSB1 bacterium]|nr:IS21 family transposase [candidate division KSB1 bacterium]
MPMKRKSMEKIREIIRIKEQSNLSERAISRALKISRPVVKRYLTTIENAGLDYQAIKEMSDTTLLEILSDKNLHCSEKYKTLHQYFPYFVKELKRTGVTLQLLWEESLKEHPDGYKYSQFCYHFQKWRDDNKPDMHIEHKAGDKVFVDFTGKHLFLVDPETGKNQPVEVFVAVLGASQKTYVQATKSQQKDDWIDANQNAFLYFQGVTNAIVPDCLKTAITKANKYEPDINPEYLDFARHYSTTILPTRPASPQDKPLVEGAVKIVYAWIFARLRNRIFHHLDELNAAIFELLDDYNNRPMQKIKISRNVLFNKIEKDALKPLPANKYVKRNFYRSKAQFNYHIYF